MNQSLRESWFWSLPRPNLLDWLFLFWWFFFSSFVQAAEGLPYVDDSPSTGSIAGIIEAGWNSGAICFGLCFCQLDNIKNAFNIMGFYIVGSTVLTFLVSIKNHRSIIWFEMRIVRLSRLPGREQVLHTTLAALLSQRLPLLHTSSPRSNSRINSMPLPPTSNWAVGSHQHNKSLLIKYLHMTNLINKSCWTNGIDNTNLPKIWQRITVYLH